MSTNSLPQPIRILIIDDDEDDFLLTQRLLNRIDSHRFDLAWTSDYESSLATILTDEHDIYLIDYNLGKGDGLSLMEQAINNGCQKPMIVLTGQGEREIDLKAMERGAADYLVKGEFTPATFERSIRYAIERSRHISALQKSEERYRALFEALRQSEVRYRGVVNAQVELVCRFKPNGILTFVNPAFCRFTNQSSEELIGTSRAALLPPERRHLFERHIQTLVKEKQAITHEVQSKLADGSDCWMQWTNQIVLDNTNAVYEIQSVGRDITTLKHAQVELRGALEKEKELSELKSRFVSMASHEFRTPLATILSTATFLLMAGNDLTDIETELRLLKIKKASNNMNELLDDVLTFGKAEAISFDFAPEKIELVSHCRRLAEDLQATSNSHEIQYSSNCEQAQTSVDTRLLHHILTNLLANAIKYSPQNKTVAFHLQIEPRAATFQIKDFGIGIPEEDAGYLFDPFHRGTNVRNLPGTGLGLAIAKNAVDVHRGSIKWQSQVAQGTTFTVTIPLEN